MRSGFSSLELIMVMMVSAIIMTSLLQIYNQVTKNMNRVDRFVFEDTQVLTLKNRLSKDLSGLSAIWFTQGELEIKQLAHDGKKIASSEKGKSSNYFYSVNKDGRLDTLTFLTTNPVQSYGSMQDRFVRVLYQVEKDPKYEGMFRLMRKEVMMPTENIDEEALKQGRFYELVGGFISLEMIYQLIDKVELEKQYQAKIKLKAQGGKEESQEKNEQKPVIRSVKKWDIADIKKDSNKKNQNQDGSSDNEEERKNDLGGAAVPKFIEMKIIFGATDTQLKKEYKLHFYIPSNLDNVPNGMLAIKNPKKAGKIGS